MKKYKFITNPGLAELNSVYMKYRTACREIGLICKQTAGKRQPEAERCPHLLQKD